jgi:hypothetical protein
MKVYAATPHVTTTQDKKKQPLAAFQAVDIHIMSAAFFILQKGFF